MKKKSIQSLRLEATLVTEKIVVACDETPPFKRLYVWSTFILLWGNQLLQSVKLRIYNNLFMERAQKIWFGCYLLLVTHSIGLLQQKRTAKKWRPSNDNRHLIVLYDGVCFSSFFILEDESLIAIRWWMKTWNLILKCSRPSDKR